MEHQDIDLIQFGRLLQRMDNQDALLQQLVQDMEEVKSHFHRRDGVKRAINWTGAFFAFLIGNVLQWYIFRGPGHS